MTIATTTCRTVARGNGASTVFNYGFLIPSTDDLVVTYIDASGNQSVLDPSTYSATGIGDPSGGAITYPLAGSPIASGTSLTIARAVPYTQPTSLVNQGGYYPAVVEAALDNLELQIQQAVQQVGSFLSYPPSDVNPVGTLPPAAARAGKFFGFDGNGNPAMLTGSALSGDLLNYTVGGAAWTNPLYASQNLINFNAGWYVTFTSALPAIIYGFASNVFRSSGSNPNFTVGAQFSGISMTGVTAECFGLNANAINQPGGLSDLVAAEFDVANQTHNAASTAKLGINIVFKDRGDGVTTAPGGLGSNQYNIGSKGLWISSQSRSLAGELCGFRRGIDFDEFALDADLNGAAIGIDFAHLHYYGGSDPLTAYRMTAAIRLRNLQTILWNGDPTLPNDPTEPANPIRTYLNTFLLPNARWVLTNTATERFGIDVVTGDIYVNGTLFSGSGTGLLASNNTWTGTNTYNAAVSIASNLTFTGSARRIIADFTNGTPANRTYFQTSTANSGTNLGVLPSGSSPAAGIDFFNSSSATNCAVMHFAIDNNNISIQSNILGSGSYIPLTFFTSGAEVMRLDTAGRLLIATSTTPAVTAVKLRVNGLVQIDNAGCFYAHRNGVDQGSISSGVFTQLVFTTVPFNQNSDFNSGTSTWTPAAGKYLIAAGVGFATPTINKRYAVIIYKNGSAFKSANVQASVADSINCHIAVVVDANGTDTFQAFVFQNSGSTASASGLETDTWFCGHRIG